MNDLNRYRPPVGLLKERVILITGAGQGIGRAAALAYASHGATVILHGRNVRKLERVYDEIEALAGPQPAIFPLDLEKAGDNDFALLAESIERQLGRLDGILHNASLLPGLAPLETHTLEQWLTVLRVNLAAPSALTRACLPLLKASPDSRVVMTSETHGHVPAAYWGAFAVAKAGIEVLVRIQAQEWEIMPNVRINAIIPGPVHSPQRSRTHPGEIKQNLKQPEDLMPVYLYLMGPDSNALSGEIVTC
ncbi:MAG TPA: YciK family oxidoreductase [Nitrosospira sp.]|nr:YciK family oxidoreductase [Nitrosospira sp.]